MNGTDADIKGIVESDITEANDVTVSGGTVTGTVGMDGALTATDGIINGDVTGAESATLDNSKTGALAMSTDPNKGDVELKNGSISGDISNAKDVTVTGSTTGDIAMNGTLAATDSNMGNVSGAANTETTGTNTVESLSTGGLKVDGTLTATTGDVTADGQIAINGDVTAQEGSVSLTGADGSTVTGDVTAAKDVTLDGTIAATGADITAGDKLNVNGTVTAQDSTLSGDDIAVNGTLNAGKGTELDGTVSGKGTINKTGGDTLALGGDTNMTGGHVNVDDASTLDAADGAHLGTVTVGNGSTLELAGEGTIGTVNVDDLTLKQGAALNADLDLNKQGQDRNDTVSVANGGNIDMGGNSLNLNSLDVTAEKNVEDGTVLNVFNGGTVTNVNEDVNHNLDTLNAHMEQNGDVVLSKNYKSAGKTENQTQTAAGLASINQNALAADSELLDVFDALNHTRSGDEARMALDALGGAGLGGIQKLLAEDTAEHMQTLRSTLAGLAAGVHRRPTDADGNPRTDMGIQSSAISGAVTGGSSQVNSNGNSGDYERNSIGFMLAGVHALSDTWTFGGDLAMSFADAKCDSTDINATAVYADVAMMYNKNRFHQMATIGFGMFDIDTEHRVKLDSRGHAYQGTATGSTQAMTVNMSYQAVYDVLKSEDGHLLSTVVMGEATYGQIDAMAEDGMGDAGLRSEFDDVASVTFATGLRYTYEFGKESNPGHFSAEALFVASAGDTMPKVNNMFIGGGKGFEVAGPEAGSAGIRLNASMLIPMGEQWGIFGNVTSEFRSEQSTVGGSVGVKYSF